MAQLICKRSSLLLWLGKIHTSSNVEPQELEVNHVSLEPELLAIVRRASADDELLYWVEHLLPGCDVPWITFYSLEILHYWEAGWGMWASGHASYPEVCSNICSRLGDDPGKQVLFVIWSDFLTDCCCLRRCCVSCSQRVSRVCRLERELNTLQEWRTWKIRKTSHNSGLLAWYEYSDENTYSKPTTKRLRKTNTQSHQACWRNSMKTM